MPQIIIILLAIVVSALAGYVVRKYIGEQKVGRAEEVANKVLIDAEHSAESKKKELLIEAKEEIHKMRSEAERENKARRQELSQLESRILAREESIEKKSNSLDKKEEKLAKKLEEAKQKSEEVDSLIEKRNEELEYLTGDGKYLKAIPCVEWLRKYFWMDKNGVIPRLVKELILLSNERRIPYDSIYSRVFGGDIPVFHIDIYRAFKENLDVDVDFKIMPKFRRLF